jgi:leucyl/phenylalanyl-tRNA---protein transferase
VHPTAFPRECRGTFVPAYRTSAGGRVRGWHDGRVPTEPPQTQWEMPSPDLAGDDDLVGSGADLEPGTLLAAYRTGLFPMPVPDTAAMLWWSPARRGVLPVRGLRVSRSLRQSRARYEIRVDTAFDEVIRACADPGRDGGWITADLIDAYTRLHRAGWVHSVEAWDADGRLAGGLYGVAIGGFFAGESMFHRRRDASKSALVALVEILSDEHADDRLIDVQWKTPHLERLGVVEVDRGDYLTMLRRALKLPLPDAFTGVG